MYSLFLNTFGSSNWFSLVFSLSSTFALCIIFILYAIYKSRMVSVLPSERKYKTNDNSIHQKNTTTSTQGYSDDGELDSRSAINISKSETNEIEHKFPLSEALDESEVEKKRENELRDRENRISEIHNVFRSTLIWFGVPFLILNLCLGFGSWLNSYPWPPSLLVYTPNKSSFVYSLIHESVWNPWLDVLPNSKIVSSLAEVRASSVIISIATVLSCFFVWILCLLNPSTEHHDKEVIGVNLSYWYRRQLKIAFIIIVLSLGVGLLFLRLTQDSSSPHFSLIPLHSWIGLALCAALILSRLLIKVIEVKPSTKMPKQRKVHPSSYNRQAWEAYMKRCGVEFQTSTDERGVSVALIKAKAAQYNATARKLNNEKRYWKHQEDFINRVLSMFSRHVASPAVEDLKKQELEYSMLMHTSFGSGKSTAIYEIVVELLSTQNKTSLLIYPTQNEAEQALTDFQEQAPKNRNQASLFSHSSAETLICFTWADELTLRILPRVADQSGPLNHFFEDIGLVIYEDIQKYSGISASALSLVNRRLFRSLRKFKKTVYSALTMSANPAELSASIEFARFISAPCKLLEHDVISYAPSQYVYGYLFKKGPLLSDAQQINKLPYHTGLAWLSMAFDAKLEQKFQQAQSKDVKPGSYPYPYSGVEVACLESDMSLSAMSDRIKPIWVDQTYQSIEGLACVEGEFVHHPSDAWISLIDVTLSEVTDLSTYLEHAGISLRQHLNTREHKTELWDHIAIFMPSLRDRAFITLLIEKWLEQANSLKKKIKSNLDWSDDILTFGKRLVVGHPNYDVTSHHVLNAIKENPDGLSSQELEDLFTEQEILADILLNFENAGYIVRQTRRILISHGDKDIMQDIESFVATSNAQLHENTAQSSLWVPPGRLAYFTDISDRHEQPLNTPLGLSTLLKVAYPGALFTDAKRHRYRVVLGEEYQYVIQKILSGKDDSASYHIPCRIQDIQAITLPIALHSKLKLITPKKKSKHGVSQHLATHQSRGNKVNSAQDLQKTVTQIVRFGDRQSISFTRGKVEYDYEHLGYYELQEGEISSHPKSHFTMWVGCELKQKISGEAYYVFFNNHPALKFETVETLRRMLFAALHLHLHLKVDHIDMIVENEYSKVIDGISLKGPAVMIIDPHEGGLGLLDSFGSEPSAFFEGVFTFIYKWARELNEKSKYKEITWTDLGESGLSPYSPDVISRAPDELINRLRVQLNDVFSESLFMTEFQKEKQRVMAKQKAKEAAQKVKEATEQTNDPGNTQSESQEINHQSIYRLSTDAQDTRQTDQKITPQLSNKDLRQGFAGMKPDLEGLTNLLSGVFSLSTDSKQEL